MYSMFIIIRIKCVGLSFSILGQARYNILPYNLKDKNEFNVVKQWLISLLSIVKYSIRTLICLQLVIYQIND